MAHLVIRQFDVFQNPTSGNRHRTPFLLVVQSHYVDGLDTVVVAPLHDGAVGSAFHLCSSSRPVVLVLSELANLPHSRLRQKAGSLAAYEDDIRRALDRLFTGF